MLHCCCWCVTELLLCVTVEYDPTTGQQPVTPLLLQGVSVHGPEARLRHRVQRVLHFGRTARQHGHETAGRRQEKGQIVGSGRRVRSGGNLLSCGY